MRERTFPVEIEVPNPDGRIIAGLTAEIHLPTERLMAHRLPPSIVSVSDEGEVGVFTLDSESRARFTPVEIVGGVGAVFWVTGLEDAADVIVVGQGFVQDGTLVEATRVEAIPNRLQATPSGRETPP